MSERAVHIKNLIALKDFCNNNGVFTLASNIEQSLNYAISSLKTDFKYDLMHEGEEVYSKSDMVSLLEEIDKEFDKQYYINRHELHNDSLNVGLEQGQNIILREINTLKGE